MKAILLTLRERVQEHVRTSIAHWTNRAQRIAQGVSDGQADLQLQLLRSTLSGIDVATCSTPELRVVAAKLSEDIRDVENVACDGCGVTRADLVLVGNKTWGGRFRTKLCHGCVREAVAAFDCTAHGDCALYADTLGRSCAESRDEARLPLVERGQDVRVIATYHDSRWAGRAGQIHLLCFREEGLTATVVVDDGQEHVLVTDPHKNLEPDYTKRSR